jgi:hypothetical protein
LAGINVLRDAIALVESRVAAPIAAWLESV